MKQRLDAPLARPSIPAFWLRSLFRNTAFLALIALGTAAFVPASRLVPAYAQDEAAEEPAEEAPAAEEPDEAPAAEAPAETPDAEAPATEAPAEAPAAETAPDTGEIPDEPVGETGGTTTPPRNTGTRAADEVTQDAPDAASARRAAELVSEAIRIGERYPAARLAVTRGAAGLVPRLDGPLRDTLTARWLRLVQSPTTARVVPRGVRLDAYSTFFDIAARADLEFARRTALALPDAAARAGAFLELSEVVQRRDWEMSRNFATLAQQAARQEPSLIERARALAFVSYRMAVLDPEAATAAIVEASSQARLVGTPRVRDYLLAEVVGAASKRDLIVARSIAASISDPELKGLATARVNMAEISETTLTARTSDRVAALAKAAVRYDTRAIPILIQLPAQTDVLKSLSDALPAIYPTARPAIDAGLLERMWQYSQTVTEPSVQRDELQSRLARLMVLHDLWRGRAWGKQLAWKGGRVQVGAFLKEVLQARRSRVQAEPLQDLAERDISRAISRARLLQPAARAEALLLLAGELLG